MECGSFQKRRWVIRFGSCDGVIIRSFGPTNKENLDTAALNTAHILHCAYRELPKTTLFVWSMYM